MVPLLITETGNKTSVNNWMDEHIELHAYDRVLRKTIGKEGTINIHSDVNESQNNYATRKEAEH